MAPQSYHRAITCSPAVGALMALASMLLPALADAQTTTVNKISNAFTSLFNSASAPSTIVAAILCMLVGLTLVFFGFRLFRIVMFLSGALFAAMVAYLILVNLEPVPGGYQIGSLSREWFYFIILIAAALIGGIISYFVWQLGLAILGALAGGALAAWIQGLKTGGLLPQIGFIILVVVLCALFSFLTLLLERFVIIVGSAMIGSVLTFVGIDFFAQTGFYQILQNAFSFRTPAGDSWNVSPGVIGMLAGNAALALIGILAQYHLWKPEVHGPRAIRTRSPPKTKA